MSERVDSSSRIVRMALMPAVPPPMIRCRVAILRSSSPLASPRGGAQLARFLEPFHCSARSAALLTSHDFSNHFTARLAAPRCSPRTISRTISLLGSQRRAAHLARFLEPFHCSARRAAPLTSHHFSHHFTSRLAAPRCSPRTATHQDARRPLVREVAEPVERRRLLVGA